MKHPSDPRVKIIFSLWRGIQKVGEGKEDIRGYRLVHFSESLADSSR